MTRNMAALDAKDNERVLWVNVLLQAIRDATDIKGSRAMDADRSIAREWFDVRNPDFNYVCHLAGMDPQRVLAKAERAIANYDATIARGEVYALPGKRRHVRGVVSNSRKASGTGGGSVAQESAQIGFSASALVSIEAAAGMPDNGENKNHDVGNDES